MGKVLATIFLVVVSFGIGVFSGWDSGVRDANNLNKEVCSVSR